MMSDSGTPELIGYAKAVQVYQDLGWIGVLPMPRGAKKNPPTIKCAKKRAKDPNHSFDCTDCVHYTGHQAINPSGADIAAWCEQFPIGNLCLHLPHDRVAIDFDAYGTKTGAAAKAEAIRRWGPLPYAPRSTSRPDDLISGIMIFSVPPGTVLEDRISFPELGVGDVELIQFHHRYVNAWPSIHPEGRQYWWRNDNGQIVGAPAYADCPLLPAAWIEGLRVVPHSEIVVGERVDIAAILTLGAPSIIVQARLSEAIKELNMPGQSRHDTACRHVLAMMRMGKTGEAGVGTALRTLCDVLVACRQVDHSATPEETVREFERMVFGERAARELSAPGIMDWVHILAAEDLKPQVAQHQPLEIQSPPSGGEGGDQEPVKATESAGGLATNDTGPPRPISKLEELERGFWRSRESLAQIYQTAMARMAPPWGTLGHCAARALTMIPPRIVLPPVIGGPGSLNFFVATVARASGGKGASAAAANVLVPKAGFVHRKIGSGEGIIAAYGKLGDDDSDPEHECIMFTTNEIDTFQALTTRSSSTTLPILREGFFGEDLGFAYSARDKRRHIPEHSYRMTLIIAAQPRRMGWLLADTDGGTPQRFMWFPAGDARISRKRPWETGPLMLPHQMEWQYPRTIIIPPEAQEEIEVAHEARSRDEGEVVDGHALFCREKFAFALAVLDGRIEMTLADWELSGIAAEVSAYTREQARQAVADAARIEALDRGEIRGIELAASDESKQFEEAERIRHALRWALSKIESAGEEGISTRDLTHSADSKRVRKWLPPALEIGMSNGLIRLLPGTTTWIKI